MKYILVILFLLLISKGYCLKHENADHNVSEKRTSIIHDNQPDSFLLNVILDDDTDNNDKLEFGLLLQFTYKFTEAAMRNTTDACPESSFHFINLITPGLIDLPPPASVSLTL